MFIWLFPPKYIHCVAYLEKKRTHNLLCGGSSQGTVSFQPPLSKLKMLWAKHSPDIIILWKLKRTTIIIVWGFFVFFCILAANGKYYKILKEERTCWCKLCRRVCSSHAPWTLMRVTSYRSRRGTTTWMPGLCSDFARSLPAFPAPDEMQRLYFTLLQTQ